MKFLFFFLLSFTFLSALEPQESPKQDSLSKNRESGEKSGPIHYLEKGSGSHHIILIHGFASHSYTWRYIIDRLAASGSHVYALDLPGFGLSDKSLESNYGLALFTQQIFSFMRDKSIDKATLIGHSMGGAVALSIAIEHPENVRSLVLVDAFVFPIKLPFYFSVAKFLGNWSTPFFGKHLTRQILKEVIHDEKNITAEQIEAYSRIYLLPGAKEAFIQTLRNFDDAILNNLAAHYQNIKIPLLIIWGENDRWMPIQYYRKVAETFPHAMEATISRCGHAPQEECPEAVLDALLNHRSVLGF